MSASDIGGLLGEFMGGILFAWILTRVIGYLVKRMFNKPPKSLYITFTVSLLATIWLSYIAGFGITFYIIGLIVSLIYDLRKLKKNA